MKDIFSPADPSDVDLRPSALRIRVRGRRAPYQPAERMLAEFLLAEHGGRIDAQVGSGHHLFVLGDAARAIDRHVAWGRATAENRVEQGGLLVGHVYRDPVRQLVYGVVGEALPAIGARSSTTFLEMSPEVWAEMLGRLQRRSAEGLAELQVIGWYHTHPGELNVYMSGTDRGTQARFFDHDWHFALVLNPHKQVYKAFQGREAIPCNVRIDEQVRLPPNFFERDAGGALSDLAPEASDEMPASDHPQPAHEGAAAPPSIRRVRLRQLFRVLKRLLRRRPALSATRPLELAVIEEDRQAGMVKIRLDGWLRRPDARRLFDKWLAG